MDYLSINDIETFIESQTTGTFTLSFGSPTLSLSSDNVQIVANDNGKLSLVFNLDDIELLQGTK